MKKFLIAFMFGVMAISAHAEATFDQVQTLIEQHQYQAAASGLEGIIQNHPKSAKAFYAMAQAQAGLGNLEKAQKALNIATGLNPTLDFAPASSVASLKQAITPQVAKIETIEESHFWRNLFTAIFALGVFGGIYMLWRQKQEKEEAAREQAEAELRAERDRERERARQARAEMDKAEAERVAKVQAAEDALKAHKNYNHERFDPANPDKLKSVAQFKAEQAEATRVLAQAEAERALRVERLRAEAAEDEARRARMHYSSTPSTTVVNNSSNDMLTGVLIGNMLSGSHHDTTRIVEREVVREAPSKSSTWDDTPSKPSRSSSWDDDSSSSSSKSSSWDSSSSSSSSSSWDSGSSSSDSGSSSSWD